MKKLFFVLLLGSCEGHCGPRTAVEDVMEPGAFCAVDRIDDKAICVHHNHVFSCSIGGIFTHKARCSDLGQLVSSVEK